MVKFRIISLLLAAAMAGMVVSSCSKKVHEPTTLAYADHATECINKDPSGTLTLKVWGQGLDEKSARTNAAKKAVEEVVFTNITGNKFNALAILPAPTARAAHREYFNKFFKDNGGYRKFVRSEKPDKKEYVYGNQQVMVPMIIVVDREKLIDKLKKDKILEK